MAQYVSMLIKPASGACNAQCKYCFYRDVSGGRVHSTMDKELSHTLISRAFEYVNEGSISFSFQGGEPTLAGLDFFRDFCSFAKAHASSNQHVAFSIQTNGLCLDDGWADLFSEYGFLIGLSIDGPQSLHDSLRGDGTHAAVMKSYNLLRSKKIETNLLTVVTKPLSKRAKELFDFYRLNRVDYAQVIPCLDPLDGSRSPWSLSPRMYAQFLKELCNLWYNSVIGGRTVRIRLFDNLILMLRGYPPEQCGLDGQCRCQFVCESNGDIYPCDFYCIDGLKSGNILQTPLVELEKLSAPFLTPLPTADVCDGCKAFGICGGNCKRYRDFFTRDKNYCPMRDFIYECYPLLYDIAHRFTRLGF